MIRIGEWSGFCSLPIKFTLAHSDCREYAMRMEGSATLLLLMPALILPVLLLVGFAACDRVFGISPVPEMPPVIDMAVGKDGTTITLTWHFDYTAQSFQIERTNPDGSIVLLDAPSPPIPFDDTGLLPATTYSYRVRAITADGEDDDWSAAVSGMTMPFVSIFNRMLTIANESWAGYTVVQRIEASQLPSTGAHVRVTLQAASIGAFIDRVYISQADPTGKPYDSAGDLTPLYDLAMNGMQSFVIPADSVKSLPIATYQINRFQALLIAIDFSASPYSSSLYTDVMQSDGATFYRAEHTSEAALQTRSDGYPPLAGVVLIANIEVG